MRSAFVFLDYPEQDIIEFLSSNFENRNNVQWIVRKESDPVLYIEFDKERLLLKDLEENEVNEIEKRFITFPIQILIIDISGRHHGETELLDFLKIFLSKFEALVMDDYTEHLWTRHEIFSKVKVRNHRFFDFEGCYNEKHNK